MISRLKADEVSFGYSKSLVLSKLSVEIPDNALTIIIGPNGSGKSTLLRSFARLNKVKKGEIIFDGDPINKQKSRSIAQRLAVLPQGVKAPDTITVYELICRGRTPHQTPLKQWSSEDANLVSRAISKTGLEDIVDRPVNSLSGGQQQRVWIAMTLAQDTSYLLLDEPTTFLDLPHQIELLNFITKLSEESETTVVAILHDINLAARFADHIIALKDGALQAEGTPEDVITPEIMETVFSLKCQVIRDPIHEKPHIIPA